MQNEPFPFDIEPLATRGKGKEAEFDADVELTGKIVDRIKKVVGAFNSSARVDCLSAVTADTHSFSSGAEGDIEKAIARSINARWHLDVYHYMRQGAKMLSSTRLSEPHKRAAEALMRAVDRVDPAVMLRGGSLFLDALTKHKSENQRLINVLAQVS